MQKKLLRSRIANDQRLAGGFRLYGIMFTIITALVAFGLYEILKLFQTRGQLTGLRISFDNPNAAFFVYIFVYAVALFGKFLARPSFLAYPDLYDNKWYLYTRLGIGSGELATKKIGTAVLYVVLTYTAGAALTTGILFISMRDVVIQELFVLYVYGLIAVTTITLVPLFLSSLADSYVWYICSLVIAAALVGVIFYLGDVFAIRDSETIAASSSKVFELSGFSPLWLWLGAAAVSVFGATVIPSNKAQRYNDMIVYPDKVDPREAGKTTGKAVYRDLKTVAAAIPAARPKRVIEGAETPEETVIPNQPAEILPEPEKPDETTELLPEDDHSAESMDNTIEFKIDDRIASPAFPKDILSDEISDEDIAAKLYEAAQEISALNAAGEEFQAEDVQLYGEDDSISADEVPAEQQSTAAVQEAEISADSENLDETEVTEEAGEDISDTIESPAETAEETEEIDEGFDLTGLDFAEHDEQTSLFGNEETADDWLDPAEARELLGVGGEDAETDAPEEQIEGQLSFDDIDPYDTEILKEYGYGEEDLPKHLFLKVCSVIALVLAVLGIIPSILSAFNSDPLNGALYNVISPIIGDGNANLIIDMIRQPAGRYIFIGLTCILLALFIGFRILLHALRKRDVEELMENMEDD